MLQSHLDPNVNKRIDKVDRLIKKYAKRPSPVTSCVTETQEDQNENISDK